MLIIGLGNPGEKYSQTRHNIGFLIIDEFAKKNNFGEFKFNKKFEALISEDNLEGKKIILAKPQTFMNESGKAVKKLIENCLPAGKAGKLSRRDGIPPGAGKIENLIIVHDDIDLPIGAIKIVKNRGSAGHKGVESIIKALNKEDFIRIRIGVLPETGKPKNPEKFVLKKFEEKEKTIVADTIKRTTDAIEVLIKDGLEKAMNEYNK